MICTTPVAMLHMAIDVIDCYGQHEVIIGTIMGDAVDIWIYVADIK